MTKPSSLSPNALLVRTLFLVLAVFLHRLPLVDSLRTRVSHSKGQGRASDAGPGLLAARVRFLNAGDEQVDGGASSKMEDLPQRSTLDRSVLEREDSKRTKRASQETSKSRLRRSDDCLECDENKEDSIQTFLTNLEAAEFPNREKSRAKQGFLVLGSILIALGSVQLILLMRNRQYRRRLILKQKLDYEERVHGHQNLSATALDDVEDYSGSIEVVEEY